MKSRTAASLLGALAGVFAAASVLLLCVVTILSSFGMALDAKEALKLLGRTAYAAGPVALPLTAGLAWWLRRGVDAGRPRGSTLLLGTLLGLPLGLLALVPALWLYGEGYAIPHLLDLTRSDTRINLGVALAGGAVGGLACAWAVSRPSKETS